MKKSNKRRERTKAPLTRGEIARATSSKYLSCKECGYNEVLVREDIKSVVCADCAQRMAAPPDNYVKPGPPSKPKPRGWHLKAYFEMDGVVYSRGQEVTDSEEIKRLRKLHGKELKPPKKPKKPRRS